MAKDKTESKLVKCIVCRDYTFEDKWRGHEAGSIVTVDEALMTIGPNLRKLTPAELKMLPSKLREIELGENEVSIDEEQPVEEAA